jgi:hypothetical protein
MSTPKSSTTDLNGFAWTYAQQSGQLEQDGRPVATGYSGAKEGKNNPALQNVPNVGPIPCGRWTITGPPLDTHDHGPYVLHLQPEAETQTHARTGFLIQGDSKANPGTASHGCIILPRAIREQVWESGDRDLEVVPTIPAKNAKSSDF